LEIKEGIWKSRIKMCASTKNLGSCNRAKRRIHAKKSIFTIKRRARRSISICRELAAQRIYPLI